MTDAEFDKLVEMACESKCVGKMRIETEPCRTWDDLKVAEKRDWLRERVRELRVNITALENRSARIPAIEDRLDAAVKCIEFIMAEQRKLESQVDTLTDRMDGLENSLGRLWARQRTTLRRIRQAEQMLGIVEES